MKQLQLNREIERNFKVYGLKAKRQVDSELENLISSLSRLEIQAQIKYALMSGGKRLRPLLVLLSAESVGGERKDVMPLALAFELLHTATLVHDDIIDRDETRRGKPALHEKWSVEDAILAGDALIAMAIERLSGYGENIIKTVAYGALELCNGELMDISFSLDDATEELYLEGIREKSASLFRNSVYCGALAGGGTATEVHSLSMFGENFGTAYQIRDDLLDFNIEKNGVLKDIKSGVITLPFIHAYSQCNPGERNLLKEKVEAYMNNECESAGEMAESILQIIQEKGSLEYCKGKIDYYINQAIFELSVLKDSELKYYLIGLAKMLKMQ